MSNRERKIDGLLSIIVILLYTVIIVIRWIMAYTTVPDAALTAVSIIGTIIQCLVILVLLYNAWRFTGSWVLRILFSIIALFLIASSIAVQIPAVYQVFSDNNIPMIF